MHIIIKRIHCFCNCSIENQTGRNEKNASKEVFKKTVKENNIENQSIPQKKNFTGTKLRVDTGIKNINMQKNLLIQVS